MRKTLQIRGSFGPNVFDIWRDLETWSDFNVDELNLKSRVGQSRVTTQWTRRQLTSKHRNSEERGNIVQFVILYFRGVGILKIHRNAVRISLPIFV